MEADAPVRLFDAFADSLKMMGWDSFAVFLQRPALPAMPHVILLKLYIYGYSIRCAPHASLQASRSAISKLSGFSASSLRTSVQSLIAAKDYKEDTDKFSRSSTSSAWT